MGWCKQVVAVGIVATLFGCWQMQSPSQIEARGHLDAADVRRIRMINTILSFVPVQVLGYLTTRLSLKQVASFAKVSGKDIPNFNTELPVEGIEPGNVRWFAEALDRQPEEPVLLVCHGGGYALGMSTYYANMLDTLYHLVDNPRLSVVWFDYKTTVQAPFPSQINEGAMIYDELTKSSKNILIMGDSAGGHMALNIIKHIHEPIEGIHTISSGLKPSGVVLISPSTSFDRQYVGSMKEFDGQDILNYKAIMGMTALVRKAKSKVATINPGDVPEIWKDAMPDFSKVFVSYGERELLRDNILRWLEQSGLDKGAKIYKDPTGMHTGMLQSASRSEGVAEIAKFLSTMTKT